MYIKILTYTICVETVIVKKINYSFQWQQTEDFSRKKEIRTHMYKLREERLRNLYSPEPGAEVKGPYLFYIFFVNK